MDVVVVVLFAMTMLVVHSLTDDAAAHSPASSATVLGLFSAQARTGRRHARRTVHGARMACPRPARRTACSARTREHGMPSTARTARRHAAWRHLLTMAIPTLALLAMALLTAAYPTVPDADLGRGGPAARPSHPRRHPLHAPRRARRRARRAARRACPLAGRRCDGERGGRGAAACGDAHLAAHLALARRQARPRRRGGVRRAAPRLRGLPGGARG